MNHPELVETELAPGEEQPAGDADAIAASAAQQVLDAIAHAVSREGYADGSALAPVLQARPEVAVPDVAVMVRRRSEGHRSAQTEAPESEEQAVLDDLASASAGLKLAVRNVREQFLRLADIEIRKTVGLAAVVPPAPRRDELDRPAVEKPSATYEPASRPEAGDAAAWGPRASAPSELYEGTVRLLVMADGNIQRIVQFVDELCQMPQFRMLRMTGSRQQDGAEISLGLREPLPFARIVASMPNVVRVDVRSPDEAAVDGGIGVTVYLAPAEDDSDLAPIASPIETDG